MVKQSKSQILAMKLKKDIDNHIYPFGSLFPSERTLSEEYHLSRTTIRDAINDLINQGYLKKSHGKGTFVTKNSRADLQINFKGMSELLKRAGFTPFSSIIASEKRKAGYKLSQIFNISENEEIFRIIRLRGGNQQPISIEDTYVPCRLVPQIENIDFQIFSLYDILASHGIQIDYINHIFSTAKVRNNEAKILNLQDGETVISIDISSYTKSKEIVEYTHVLVVSEFCGFYSDSYFKNGEAFIYAQSN